jgi:hypothetical protein
MSKRSLYVECTPGSTEFIYRSSNRTSNIPLKESNEGGEEAIDRN